MPFADLIGHQRAIALLRSTIRQDRVAHAYLFHGEDRIGKRLVAIRFAQAVNCDDTASAAQGDACGRCRSCTQIEAGTHPDVTRIEPDPEQANPQIKIERVREMESQIIYRPLVGRLKTVIIDEADRLTLGAANALLKTLEEPPAHSLFVLVSSRPLALPGTIRSRCQAVRFVPPARTDVERALAARRQLAPPDARFLAAMTQARIGEALGADLAALRQKHADYRAVTSMKALGSPAAALAIAEALAKGDGAAEALDWVARWLRDLVLVKIGADADLLLDAERLTELRDVARRADADALLDLVTEVESLERATARNVNGQIALETLLLRIRDVLSAGTGLEARGSER
jgi:DNA polymerase III subunit delta'